MPPVHAQLITNECTAQITFIKSGIFELLLLTLNAILKLQDTLLVEEIAVIRRAGFRSKTVSIKEWLIALGSGS